MKIQIYSYARVAFVDFDWWQHDGRQEVIQIWGQPPVTLSDTLTWTQTQINGEETYFEITSLKLTNLKELTLKQLTPKKTLYNYVSKKWTKQVIGDGVEQIYCWDGGSLKINS